MMLAQQLARQAGHLTTAERRRRFVRACRQYRDDAADYVITEEEAWTACKGLLGTMDVMHMVHLLRELYGDERVRSTFGEARKDLMRRVARVKAMTIRRALAADPAIAAERARHAAAHAFVVHPPPPPPPDRPVPPPPAPAPQAAAAAAAAAAAPQQAARVLPSTFDALRVMIAADGNFSGMVPDDITPGQIAMLFSEIDDLGECPICLNARAKLHQWTYECGHRACHACFSEYVVAALKGSGFPIRCPGRCGAVIDPRLVLDVLGLSTNGVIGVPEPVLRFVSLQLSATCAIDPDTAGERVSCPACRTVVCGRPDRRSPVARCTNPFCATRLCSACKTPWHDGRKCDDIAADDAKTAELLAATAKPCPHCGRMAGHFRNHACHHLTCPCGHQYCYECLEPWSAHTATGARQSCRIFCWEGCHCVECQECRPGVPCRVCTGCSVCRAAV